MKAEKTRRYLRHWLPPSVDLFLELDALEAALDAWQSQAVAMEAECERLREWRDHWKTSYKEINGKFMELSALSVELAKRSEADDKRIARLEEALRRYGATVIGSVEPEEVGNESNP